MNAPDSTTAILVLGFLWTGKTTLIEALSAELTRQEKPVTIIINDSGLINTDALRLADYETTAITNSCICCSSIDDLELALLKAKDTGKTIIIEPTGIADGTALSNLLRKHRIQWKTVSLTTWADLPHETSNNIQDIQLDLAHVIGITHWWSQETKIWLEEKYSETPVFLIPDISKALENVILADEDPNVFQSILAYPHQEFKEWWIPEKHERFPNTSISSQDVDCLFTTQWLEAIIDQLGPNLQRAKGVIGWRAFDVTCSTWFIQVIRWKSSDQEDFLTVIVKNPLENNSLKQMCIDCLNEHQDSTNSFGNTIVPREWKLSSEEIQQQTNKLLEQYTEYMALDQRYNELEKTYETNKDLPIAQKMTELKAEMQALWDDMKYNNPFIWLDYKLKAYAHLPEKKVTTIAELRKHCERETYICHKRLDYLNKVLKEKYAIDLQDDDSVAPDTSLAELLEKSSIIDLSHDESFMKERLAYEYFSLNGGTNKRENYVK